MMIDQIGVSGYWKATVTRADGSIEKHEQNNAINSSIKDKIADALNSADTRYAIGSNLHSNDGSGQGSNSSALTGIGAGTAGISMSLSGLSGYYGMASSVETTITSDGSTGYYVEWRGTIRVTQSYTVTDIYLGADGNSQTGAFNILYATGSNWSDIALTDGDQLDVVWRVTVT